MSNKNCDFCDNPLPEGCYGIYGCNKECVVGEPKTKEWKIGRAIWDDLTDRCGVKHELQRCDDEVKAEIIETMGKIAIKTMKRIGAP